MTSLIEQKMTLLEPLIYSTYLSYTQYTKLPPGLNYVNFIHFLDLIQCNLTACGWTQMQTSKQNWCSAFIQRKKRGCLKEKAHIFQTRTFFKLGLQYAIQALELFTLKSLYKAVPVPLPVTTSKINSFFLPLTMLKMLWLVTWCRYLQ